MTTITSTELNFLVFRYLKESGFIHSAFTLGYEAGLNKVEIDGNLVPPGALISFVQKGLQYLELEANLSEDGTDLDGDFSLLQPVDLLTKDVGELRQLIKERREKIEREKKEKEEKEKEKEKERLREREREKERERERERQEREKERERERLERERDREKEKERERDRIEKDKERERDEKIKIRVEETKIPVGGAPQLDVAVGVPLESNEIHDSDVTFLEGHTSEVFICAWSPTGSLLASGSGDSTARIWTIPDGCSGSKTLNSAPKSLVLKHFKGKANEKSKDVTTLDWNGEGTLLATGSYDGQARIWNKDGELKNTLNKHKGPIFSLKWNKKGDCLLSGSVDKTAIVWDAKTGDVKQQFEYHAAPTLDVDWRNNNSFATCSTDHMIYVCKLGEQNPIKSFSGHEDEVNAIKWDPTGMLLASCSDDHTAKIWSMKQEKCQHDFREHTKEIYTIKWSPTGPGTSNPNADLILASASFDATIKLWNIERGSLLYSLTQHRCLHIWSVKDGSLVKTYRGSGGIFEVCWNKEGDKVAACFSNNTVCVLDFRS
ncbi:hypothetical protein O6H91_11G068900 [Diphasiastrum complanatum]|uniref:Uncharacterized protein n=1 Tax=Diphasiastrum complanatum TaxID=34168 RepID=A0ACC2CA58_DIPCM|nr:hypothetical protein O6H91_11G068900 [Diphasiastrum complanatum]